MTVSKDLAQSRCDDSKHSLGLRYVGHRLRGAIPSSSARRKHAAQLFYVGGLNTLNMDGPPFP